MRFSRSGPRDVSEGSVDLLRAVGVVIGRNPFSMCARRQDLGHVRVIHPLQWLWEPLETDRTFMLRSMFGAKAVYLDGKLMLCFCHGQEPWQGMLICTDHGHHASLQAEFSSLSPHPILSKWLYLRVGVSDFELTGEHLVQLVRQRDPRIGIASRPRKKRRPTRAQRPT
jgi:hypothetical protein